MIHWQHNSKHVSMHVLYTVSAVILVFTCDKWTFIVRRGHKLVQWRILSSRKRSNWFVFRSKYSDLLTIFQLSSFRTTNIPVHMQLDILTFKLQWCCSGGVPSLTHSSRFLQNGSLMNITNTTGSSCHRGLHGGSRWGTAAWMLGGWWC